MVIHKCIWPYFLQISSTMETACDEILWPMWWPASLWTYLELDHFVKCVTCFWYIVLQLFCRSSHVHKRRPPSSHASSLNRCIHHLPWFICFIMYAFLVVLPRDVPDRIIWCFSAISVVFCISRGFWYIAISLFLRTYVWCFVYIRLYKYLIRDACLYFASCHWCDYIFLLHIEI